MVAAMALVLDIGKLLCMLHMAVLLEVPARLRNGFFLIALKF